MSAWIPDGEIAEAAQPLALATIKPQLKDLTAKELSKAEEAKEFVRKAGYPSEDEAVYYVHDGNFDSIPIEAKAVRTSYKELGEHPAVSRGKMTKRKVSWGQEKDSELIFMEKRK